MASDVGLISSTGGIFRDGAINIATQYAWVLWLFVGLAVVILIGVIARTLLMKKKQWTHTLKVRFELQDKKLSREKIYKMRRFPLIKRAEVFELENPLLGGYLFPEVGNYTDVNEFSIIIDKNNRIYTCEGEYFNPNKSSINVSAKHAEIDISRSDLRADFQDINQVQKKIEWAQVAKFAMIGLLIIAVMIVSIKGIGAWGESKETEAQSNAAFASAMANLAEALKTSQATVNGLNILTDEIKILKGTDNIQGIVREANNETL